MRNLYQSPSPSINHQHSYPGTSQIETVENHVNHTSPKIIQVHHRNANSPSTCFVNKQAFFQTHQSPKIKSIIQASGYLNHSSTELVKPPVPRAFKLSSSSVSSGFTNQDLQNQECNIKPSSILRTKNTSPLIVNSCSSSSSSSSSSPVLKNMEHQNERFFDSNTLYKKELKQKQRDILSTSINSGSKNAPELSPQKTPQAQLQLQKLQQSIMKHELERQICEMSQSHFQSDENLTQNLSRNEKRSTLPHNLNSLNQSPTSNNKVLNLFSNLLNRNKSEPNYLSIKNLKRATSSSQFNKSKLNESTSSTSPKSADSKIDAKTSLTSLFKVNKSGEKMRRSFDDVARYNTENQSEAFINFDHTKYENTAFSTKNNGLIFLPQKTNLENYENLENLENYDTGSTTICNSNSSYSPKVTEHATKPSDEILKRINSLTKSNDESNAFDNIVYSYVNNIRHHSKRLSEINLFQSNAIAAASAAAAAAVSSLNEQNSHLANSNGLSCSSGSSSSNSFHSPKSVDTVVNSFSNVMTLREKFESIGSESPKSSLKSISIKSDNLSVNTSVSNGIKNNLNSPALSSVSSASSRSSAISGSLSSGSFSKEAQNQHNDIVEENEFRINNVEKNKKNELNIVKNKIIFNYYFEFYRFNLSADEPEDEKFKLELENIRSLNQKLLSNYDKILADFINNFYPNNVFLKNVLDPILADSFSTYSSNSSLFNFKFTIEFFKPILTAAKMNVLPSCSTNFNAESYKMINERNESNLEEKFLNELNLNLYAFNSSSYSQLFKELEQKLSVCLTDNIKRNNYDILRTKLMLFILYKLEYFNDEIRIVQRAIELNDKLGVKIQKELENESNMSSVEMEKFKLLVNESDVLTNLLLKLCNKIAQTENTIQIMQLVDLNSNLVSEAETLESKLACEEVEMLKQELNQIYRKKEEALYLKNGIDKRAVIVMEILSKYKSREKLDEFEKFLNSKIVNALKQRHLNDHIELAQIQLKILNDLKFN